MEGRILELSWDQKCEYYMKNRTNSGKVNAIVIYGIHNNIVSNLSPKLPVDSAYHELKTMPKELRQT